LANIFKIKNPNNGLPRDIEQQFHDEVDAQAPIGVSADAVRGILGANNAGALDADIDILDASADEYTQDACEAYTRRVIDPVVARFNETWQGLIGHPLNAEDLENFKLALEAPSGSFESLTLCGVEVEAETIKLSCSGFVELAASANGVSAAETGLDWITSLPLLRR